MVGTLALMMLSSCGGKKGAQGAQQGLPEYPVATVQPEHATLVKTLPVTIKGQEDISINPRIDGFIKELFVDEGSVVKKGQVMFTIDSPSAKQALVTAEANLRTAELNVERIKPLAEKGIVSDVQLQTYQNAYDSAKAVYEQAKETMGWTQVSSPVNGVVGQVPYRQGSLVSSAVTLTTVANIDKLYAYFSINEKQLLDFLSGFEGRTQAEKIKNMPLVTLTLADGTVYEEKGRIETISGVIDVATGAANLRALFPNVSNYLRSGMSGNVSIPREVDNVFVIPQASTFAQQDKILVYKAVANEEGVDVATQAIVTVELMPDGVHYAVTSGLEPGDRIITDGIATLRNGIQFKAK